MDHLPRATQPDPAPPLRVTAVSGPVEVREGSPRKAHIGPHRVEPQLAAHDAVQPGELRVERLRRPQVQLLHRHVKGHEPRQRRMQDVDRPPAPKARHRPRHVGIGKGQRGLLDLQRVHRSAARLDRPAQLSLPVERERPLVEATQQVEVGRRERQGHVRHPEHRLADGERHVPLHARPVAPDIQSREHVLHRMQVLALVVDRDLDRAAPLVRNAPVNPGEVGQGGTVRLERDVPSHRQAAPPPQLGPPLPHRVRQREPVEVDPDRVVVLAHQPLRPPHPERRVALVHLEPAHREELAHGVGVREAHPSRPRVQLRPAQRTHVALAVGANLRRPAGERHANGAVAAPTRQRVVGLPRLHQQHGAVGHPHAVDHHVVAELPASRGQSRSRFFARKDVPPVRRAVGVVLHPQERARQLHRAQHDLAVDQVAHVEGHVDRPGRHEHRVELVAHFHRVDAHVAQQRAAEFPEVERALHLGPKLRHHRLAHPVAPELRARHGEHGEPRGAEDGAEREGAADQDESPESHAARTPARWKCSASAATRSPPAAADGRWTGTHSPPPAGCGRCSPGSRRTAARPPPPLPSH